MRKRDMSVVNPLIGDRNQTLKSLADIVRAHEKSDPGKPEYPMTVDDVRAMTESVLQGGPGHAKDAIEFLVSNGHVRRGSGETLIITDHGNETADYLLVRCRDNRRVTRTVKAPSANSGSHGANRSRRARRSAGRPRRRAGRCLVRRGDAVQAKFANTLGFSALVERRRPRVRLAPPRPVAGKAVRAARAIFSNSNPAAISRARDSYFSVQNSRK